MQSASDSVLASMRRKYDYKFYLNTLTMIKDYFPKAGIGADIITGYPGEVDEDFELTYYRLKEELPITHFHVFPYSKRKGTTASRLADHIQADEKKRRVRELIKLGEQKLTQFAASHVGGINQVLFETYKDGHMTGLSETFLKCRIKTDLDLSNQIHHVKIINSNQAQLVGQLV
jgi:threonylcarbamoyladenosine tRNA methylthiotransferase MtaB